MAIGSWDRHLALGTQAIGSWRMVPRLRYPGREREPRREPGRESERQGKRDKRERQTGRQPVSQQESF